MGLAARRTRPSPFPGTVAICENVPFTLSKTRSGAAGPGVPKVCRIRKMSWSPSPSRSNVRSK